MVEYYKIPTYMRAAIKDGCDFTTPDGETIPNNRLTSDADPSRSYAYCSDTLPCPQNNEYIANVDLLYHEATFAQSEESRAKSTYHSTAREAAGIALAANAKRLIIGHFSSRYTDESVLLDEAREIFPCTELADEGKVFRI